MPKRFEPHRRLLQLLVGSNLYGSPDACIRELIQNAWDAIQLRRTHGDGSGGTIDIRYSKAHGWFEVVDDGIGMDMRTVENSFLEIGQDKLTALGQGTRETQIGYFGIGILSIFLVANRFQVTTKHVDAGAAGICFEIPDMDHELVPLTVDDMAVGTRIKIFVRAECASLVDSLPTKVQEYVRHVSGIRISSDDDGTTMSVPECWTTAGVEDVRVLDEFPGLIAGRFAVNPALRGDSGVVSNDIAICNAGFLVETDVHDLLPVAAAGMVGEINLKPNTLTIGMSRERIQRDARWLELGARLQENFVRFALDELRNGALRPLGELDGAHVKRNLLLWYHYLPNDGYFAELRALLEERIVKTVPFGAADRGPVTLQSMFDGATESGKLFYRELDARTEHTERIQDDGVPIRISQEVRDSIRVGALRAKGFDVVELSFVQVNIRNGSTVQTQQIRESQLVAKCLESRGLVFVNIVDASELDMDLQSIEKLPILNDALSVGGLRFASIPESRRRVITDSTGIKYVNVNNHDIRRILEIVPAAISNPLKRRLLDAYLKVENFQLYDARQILTELLLAEDLASMASVTTASCIPSFAGIRSRRRFR